MKIAIIDPFNQDIGLKILFPEADYFIIKTEFNREESYIKHNISLKHDWSVINDTTYDYLFVVIALYDAYKGNPNVFDTGNQNVFNSLQRILDIVSHNNFKKVFFFDNYDYDYDPNIIVQNNKIDLFFKRNYSNTKVYEKNVIPFPFIMFGPMSLIEKFQELVSEDDYFIEKRSRVFFSGILFCHEDNKYGVFRNRKIIYNEISNTIYNPGYMNYTQFINTMRNSKFCVDLLGVGEPNKRTFEILLSGSLMLSQKNDLKWPFSDAFDECTIFNNSQEYMENLIKLSNDSELYERCLKKQYNIVKKYFNKEWLRDYIIGYF